MKYPSRILKLAAAAALVAGGIGASEAAVLTFDKLTGVTGGSLAGTAVYKADLSTLGSGKFASLLISDDSGGFGGAGGAFSGFDLDAVVISSVDCASAACAQGATDLGLLNFASMAFTAGTQRAPVDPAGLFGTNNSVSINNAVATLGTFDGESTTAIPGAFGFASLGDFGKLAINLTAPTATTGLFLYIGEVGDNGEVAGSNISLLTTPLIPEPGTYALMSLGLAAVAGLARYRRR